MKTNLFKTTYFLLLSSFLLTFSSCEKEDTSTIQEKTTTIQLSKIELAALKQNGIIPENNLVEEFKGTILGENLEGIFIDDNFISYQQLDQQVKNLSSAKLFLNKNRIELPTKGKRTITIGIVEDKDGAQGLNNKQRNAAQTAIHRYKALNLKKLDFEILIGVQNFGDERPDIVIIGSDGFAGVFDGRALFPSDGNPGNLIGIHTRTRPKNWPQTELISLIMHEMGHAIGLIHSDYKTRESCIPFGLEDEGDFSDSQVDEIPGTDTTGKFTNSIMRACNFYAIGDFTTEDKKSLRRAYNGESF